MRHEKDRACARTRRNPPYRVCNIITPKRDYAPCIKTPKSELNRYGVMVPIEYQSLTEPSNPLSTNLYM